MPLTADVKAELMAVRDPRPTARVAELTSLLRFSGTDQPQPVPTS